MKLVKENPFKQLHFSLNCEATNLLEDEQFIFAPFLAPSSPTVRKKPLVLCGPVVGAVTDNSANLLLELDCDVEVGFFDVGWQLVDVFVSCFNKLGQLLLKIALHVVDHCEFKPILKVWIFVKHHIDWNGGQGLLRTPALKKILEEILSFWKHLALCWVVGLPFFFHPFCFFGSTGAPTAGSPQKFLGFRLRLFFF